MDNLASTNNPSSSNSGRGGFWETVIGENGNSPVHDELTERCQNQINYGARRDYASQSHDDDAILDTRELREAVALRYLERNGNLANTIVRPLQSGSFSGELRVFLNGAPMNMTGALFNIIRN